MTPEETVLQYVREVLLSGRGDLTVESKDDLLGSGLVDSLGMMRLVGFLEEHYQTAVPMEDVTIENFLSVEAIAAYLARRSIS